MTKSRAITVALKIRRHIKTANQAFAIAQEHRHSAIGDYAESLAASQLKRALAEERATPEYRRTHLGRMFG